MQKRILAAATAAVAVGIASQSFAASASWVTNGSGAWGVDANWTAAHPDGIDQAATISLDFTSASTITLDGNYTVGSLTLADTTAPFVALTVASTPATNALTFDVTSGNATLTNGVTGGVTNTISSPLTLNDSLTLVTNSGLTLSGAIGGTGGIDKTATAVAITLSGNNTFAGGVTLRQNSINFGGAAAFNPIGTGTFTFANPVGGLGDTFTLNAAVSKVFANDFVNNNAAQVTATQYAQISTSGGSSGYRTLTFNGNFSTGVDYNATQGIVFQPFTGAAATGEDTYFLNGNLTNYQGGAANGQAFRIAGGSTVFGGVNSTLGSGGILINGNDATVASKLIVGVASTHAEPINFAGAANGMRNGYGARNAAASTVNHTGTIALSDADGANLFSTTSGAILNVSGLVSGANGLRINDGYSFTSADVTNTFQTSQGTVQFSRAAGNTNTGAVTVANGTLLVTNTSGNGVGTGALRVGVVGAATSTGTGTTVAASRVITAVDNALVGTLQIGQSLTLAGTTYTITGLTIGAATSTIVVSAPIAAAGTGVAFTTAAYAGNATLAGNGFLNSGATNNGVTILAGSRLAPGNGGAGTLTATLGTGAFDIGDAVAATATASMLFDLATPGASDAVVLGGTSPLSIGTAGLEFNDFSFTPGVGFAAGTYTLFDTSASIVGTLGANLTGTVGGLNATLSLANGGQDVVLTVAAAAVPEPTTLAAIGVGAVTLLRRRRRRRRA